MPILLPMTWGCTTWHLAEHTGRHNVRSKFQIRVNAAAIFMLYCCWNMSFKCSGWLTERLQVYAVNKRKQLLCPLRSRKSFAGRSFASSTENAIHTSDASPLKGKGNHRKQRIANSKVYQVQLKGICGTSTKATLVLNLRWSFVHFIVAAIDFRLSYDENAVGGIFLFQGCITWHRCLWCA